MLWILAIANKFPIVLNQKKIALFQTVFNVKITLAHNAYQTLNLIKTVFVYKKYLNALFLIARFVT